MQSSVDTTFERATVGLATLVIAFLAAGCSSDDSGNGSSTSTGGATSSGGVGGAAGVAGSTTTGGAGGGTGGTGDTSPACLPPSTAPDPWTPIIATNDGSTNAPLDGVVCSVLRYDDTELASGTTVDGQVQLSVPTGGVPVEGYVRCESPGYLASVFRQQVALTPFAGPLTFGMMSETAADAFVQQYWGVDRAPAASITRINVLQCNKGGTADGIENATIEAEHPGAGLLYATANAMPSTSLTATSSSGRVWGANIPDGANTITVALDGVETVKTVDAHPNANDTIIIYPLP